MRSFCILILALFITACSTLKVQSDYDESYNFKNVKTFVVQHNTKEGENTLVNKRISNALEDVLLKKGYKKTTKDRADLIFLYHYNVANKVDIQTDYQMVGIRRYGFGGTMVATTTAYEYKEGNIIIDALDRGTHQIVFRVVGNLELQSQETPQERTAYVHKIIAEVMKAFPPELKKK